MKNIKIDAFIFSVILVVIMCVTACDNSDDPVSQDTENNQPSNISVSLTDAPGEYDAVNLEVVDVLIKKDPNIDGAGWVSIAANHAASYNVMDLTGGTNVLIANTWISTGYLSQIQLVLGEKNTIIKNGVSYPLTTPSVHQSGFILKVNKTLEPGLAYNFVLDFDIDKSIVKTNNPNEFILKPVIRISW